MNKLLKKVLVLTLMIAMVFSIAACGGDESTDDENGGGTELLRKLRSRLLILLTKTAT